MTKTPAYFGTSVEMRGDDVEVLEIRVFEDAGTVPDVPDNKENKENALDEGRFFIAKKQLELLKLKGEF